MVPIGDFFPNREKRKIINRSFVPFQVYYLFCPQLSNPSNKFLLLVCIDPPIFFYISTKPRNFVFNEPYMRECIVGLHPDNNPFLSHFSHTNCAEVEKKLTKSELKSQLFKDMGRIKEPIDSYAQKEVIKAIKKGTTLEPKDRKKILAFLQQTSEIKDT